MVQYFLDLEINTDFPNERPNPERDNISTIQYQKLDFHGNPVENEPLIILKSWESSEEDIVKKFFSIFMNGDEWSFIPIGFNLTFEMCFLHAKFKKYGLINKKDSFLEFMFKRKLIDIQPAFLLANNLSFRNSGMDKMTNKTHDGKIVLQWFKDKEYNKIEDYVKEEAEIFLQVFKIIRDDLILSKDKWKRI